MEKQFCEYCGNKLQDDETICSNCGAVINDKRSMNMKEKFQGFKESVKKLSKKKKILIGLLCIVLCIACIGTFGGGDESSTSTTDANGAYNQSEEDWLNTKVATILSEHLSVCSDNYDIGQTTYSIDTITEVADGKYDIEGYYILYRKNNAEKTRPLDFKMTINKEGQSYCESEMASGRYY